MPGDLEKRLAGLRAAAGDPQALALAAADFLLDSLPPEEGAQLRTTLEAAAVPHWFDTAMFVALLAIPEAEAAARLERLRSLPFIERFPARGEHALNVHEATRLALRRRLAEQEPERFRALSARAAEALAGQTTVAARIERACHLAVAQPTSGAKAIEDLREEWDFGGRFEEAQALAAACEELRGVPGLAAEARAMLALTVAMLRKVHLPTERRLSLLREAATLYREKQDDWQTALTLEQLGDSLIESGQPEEARIAHDEALRIRRRLAPPLDALTLATAEALRNVSVSLDGLGDLDRQQGRPEPARAAYAEGLQIARRLATLDPANTQWQRDVSISLNKLGDLDREQGRPEPARAAYAEVLEIRRRLAALDPANTEWQRDLSVSLNKLGDLDREQGRPEPARAAYAEGLEIARQLAALDPANTEWQRDVSVSLNKLGGLDHEQGRPELARAAFAEGLEICRRLAALDPAKTQWQRDVSVSLERLGNLDREQGRPEPARTAYAEVLEIRRRLAALDPTNTQWQRDVSYSLHVLGRLLLDGGQAQEAVPLFSEALGISEKLAALDPQNVTWQQDVRAYRHWLEKARAAEEKKD